MKYARSEENVAQLVAKILIKFLQVSFGLAKVSPGVVQSFNQSTNFFKWVEKKNLKLDIRLITGQESCFSFSPGPQKIIRK